MKHLLLLICGWTVFISTQAQEQVLEKMWNGYHQATTDTAKARVLIQLSMYYSEINGDSAFSLARQAFHLAELKGNKELALNARGAEALAFVKIGASQQALAIVLKCLQGAEALKNQQLIMKFLNLIAFVYSEIDELDKGIQYCYKIIELLQTNEDKGSELGVYINIGDFYYRKNQLDSARYYNNKAFDLAEKMQDKDLIALVQNNFGNIFRQMQQPEMALLYYRQSLPQALATNYTSVLCESSLGIARIFEKNRQYDSSLHYANQSLAAASRAKYSRYILESTKYLADCYTKTGNSDSTVKYLTLSMSLRDSLFNREKLNLIKAMELQEVARQQDLAHAAEQDQQERRQNIQYAIIFIGIITLIVLVLLLSRSFIVHHTWVRFLGVLSLLLIFEFINLYLHPVLTNVTGHSPIFMLLVMAGIAALLIPMHHRMEHWIIGRLVEKNKQIRLATAKRIVENLEGS